VSTIASLRVEVLEANLDLVRRGLVLFQFGNASGIDRERALVVIKPSGVAYDTMTPGDMVVTDMNGRVVEGRFKPSIDLPSHLALYDAFPEVGGVAHTHSRFATIWAQAGLDLPCLGTTHADYFRGAVPVTAPLDPVEIETDYEAATGRAIVRRMTGLAPLEMPAALVVGHAPFCWGRTATEAAVIAAVLEEVASMAYHTATLANAVTPLSEVLREKHFRRKHGPTAYYGQK
jgi:L-ribulose-5-phosphate 4-epimerase